MCQSALSQPAVNLLSSWSRTCRDTVFIDSSEVTGGVMFVGSLLYVLSNSSVYKEIHPVTKAN